MAGVEYTLRGLSYELSARELQIVNDNAPENTPDWGDSNYSDLKLNIKQNLNLNQYNRCAYCRRELETDGIFEHLDHIVPKHFRPRWLLTPKNLVLSCPLCNSRKGTKQTLNDNFLNSESFPETTNAFKIINPHFDKWQDHLMFENDIFITPLPDSKGAETIKTCKLYRYNVIMNRAKELKLIQKEPLSRITHMMRGSKVIIEEQRDGLLDAIDRYVERMSDNPNFS